MPTQTPEAILRSIIERSITAITDNDVTSIGGSKFNACTLLQTAIFPNVTSIGNSAFDNTSLSSIYLPNLGGSTGSWTFQNCTSLQYAVFPSITKVGSSSLANDTALLGADLGSNCNTLDVYCFKGCTSLNKLILRRSTAICRLNGDALQNTPFDQNGAGGTIYIPQVLYNHLGDGTALDYKASTRWSTLDAYGKTTWAKIEGSQYENYYVDGTPIPAS